MNYNLKPLLGLSYAVMALLIAFLAVQTNHVLNTAETTNTVSFNGEGKITAKPDIAMISASIVTQSADAKTAQDQNSEKSTSVTNFLKSQGIADADIKTSSYNIYPQYNYYGGQSALTGYQVNQSFDIKVRDLSKVSKILSGLVAAGANQVNNLGLQIEKQDDLKSQARRIAISEAKKKATQLEGEVGISLGKIVNFSESGSGTPPIYYEAMGKGGGGGGGPDISNGTNDIIVDVTLTYQIK